jgi:Uma2 family endonuclease
MSSAPRLVEPHPLPLYSGDSMAQAEFHRRYEAYPDDAKIELIGGIVYMASPLRRTHGVWHLQIGTLLTQYSSATPGVEALDNVTTILGEESEPQPDLALRVLWEYGGQSRETKDDYVEGAPELVAEIAYSTRSIDLHQKRVDYQRAGVREYLVLCIEGPELIWFAFRTRGRIRPDSSGISRSRVFPGLWIDTRALLGRDISRQSAVLLEGLGSPEHAAFVRGLARSKQKWRGKRP